MSAHDPHCSFRLDGHVALITGASSGIGQRMSLALANAGAKSILLGRDQGRLEKAEKDISNAGGQAASLVVDLNDRDVIHDVHEQAAKPFGDPTILINAAGVNLREPWQDVTLETWDQTLHLNLTVPFFLARACVPRMIEKGYGRIINIASLQSFRAFANSMPYGASKGGIVQLTRSMAEAWSKDGVTANAIAPGFFPTGLTAPVFNDPDKAAHNANMTAIGRNGELDDLDGLTVFLSSPASAYITGQTISLDGGYSAK